MIMIIRIESNDVHDDDNKTWIIMEIVILH